MSFGRGSAQEPRTQVGAEGEYEAEEDSLLDEAVPELEEAVEGEGDEERAQEGVEQAEGQKEEVGRRVVGAAEVAAAGKEEEVQGEGAEGGLRGAPGFHVESGGAAAEESQGEGDFPEAGGRRLEEAGQRRHREAGDEGGLEGLDLEEAVVGAGVARSEAGVVPDPVGDAEEAEGGAEGEEEAEGLLEEDAAAGAHAAVSAEGAKRAESAAPATARQKSPKAAAVRAPERLRQTEAPVRSAAARRKTEACSRARGR